MARIYVAEKIPVSAQLRSLSFTRADLQLFGVDHSGATYEGRIFLNNELATAETPLNIEDGYAGSFYVFGHGGCFGSLGHCEVPTAKRAYDFRPPHPLTPETKIVTITETLRRELERTHSIAISIVPIVKTVSELYDSENVLRFRGFEVFTYA